VRRAKLRISLLLFSKASTPHCPLTAACPRFASCLQKVVTQLCTSSCISMVLFIYDLCRCQGKATAIAECRTVEIGCTARSSKECFLPTGRIIEWEPSNSKVVLCLRMRHGENASGPGFSAVETATFQLVRRERCVTVCKFQNDIGLGVPNLESKSQESSSRVTSPNIISVMPVHRCQAGYDTCECPRNPDLCFELYAP
jgi:hypothetical protein